jgi:dCMP deaminase
VEWTQTSVIRPSWDETWMQVADAVAKRSRCSRAQIGAVVVSKDQRISSTGYNGPSAMFPHEGECINWCPRAQGVVPLTNTYDSCPSIHAEANALLYVDRSRVEDGTIYITDAACYQCAKLISNSGIKRVVMRIGTRASHRLPDETVEYFIQCNIDVVITKDVDDE